ncbi:MAG: phage portal protein [Polaromonas sp.]
MARRSTGNPTGRPPSQKTLIARQVAHALQAQAAPSLPKISARYDSAGRGRRMAGWNPPSSGPNLAVAGLQTIRDRARDSSRNDWSAESAIQKWTTNLVGIGITPRFKRIADKARKRTITDLWNDFAEQSDADCVLNLYGQQSLAVRSWLDSGEVFARRRPRFQDEGLAVPVQVQLIESDMVPLLDADTYQGLPQGNKIRSGIELDKRGKRVAYWVYKEHPGDGGNMAYGASDLIRVPASDMCHVFEQKRPGQLRGVSVLAPILARLRNIESYDDATLERQKLANMIVGFIKRDLPPAAGDEDIDPLTGQPIDQEGPSGPLLGMQPGLLQELDDGQSMEWSNPPEAGTTYSDYMRTQHMGTAAAAGLPYEVHSGDIANVSDRTLRVLINEFRRFAEARQWQIIIPMFCQRVINWFVDAAVLAGKISMEEADDARRVEHSPHGWAHIHPVQDPTGKKIEVENGFISRSSVIGARGDDPDAVDEERQADDARQQALAIGPYSKANQQINNPPAPKALATPATPQN